MLDFNCALIISGGGISSIIPYTEIGGNVLDNFEDDKEMRFQRQLEEAIADAEAKAEREKQRALMRLTKQMEEAQANALSAQQDYFEAMAERVSEQRDR